MQQPYIPKLGINKPAMFDGNMTLLGTVQKTGMMGGAEGASFKQVLGNTLSNVSEVVGAPDALMKQAMTTGNVDVHEVMIANAKAELTVNMTAQMVTKVVQAYDKILQIQI